jgi:hypothetical protein
MMTIPRWSTIGLFALLLMQVILSWLQAKKRGKGFRGALVPTALMAGAISIAFAREFFVDLPVYIDVILVILCWLLILIALGFWLVQLKRYLKESWRLEDKTDK